MDRSYQCHKNFDLWQEAGKHSVCRIKACSRKTCLKVNHAPEGSPVFYDPVVWLGTRHQNLTPRELRVAGYRGGNVADWHGKFILVRRSYKRGRIGHTKTGKQRRVDMSNQLLVTLRDFHLTRKKEALESGTGKVEEFILHRNGKPIAQNSIRYPFKRNLEKAGLREIRVHDIRHTYASLLFTDGASPVYVKEQMGHSSIQITVDSYGHMIPNSNRDMVNRLDSQPSATQPQPAKIKKA